MNRESRKAEELDAEERLAGTELPPRAATAARLRARHEALSRHVAAQPAWAVHKLDFDRRYELARALQRARRRAGLTQTQLARLIGTKQPALARIESGRISNLDTIARYAAACGCDVHVAIRRRGRRQQASLTPA
jgi:DNA-binding XRE family transcriptional regulator